MTKPKTKPKVATRSTARKPAKPVARKRSAPAPSRSAARPDTKHARIIAMLRMPTGATIAAIIDRVNYRLEKRASAGRWSHFCEAIACEGPESLRHDLFCFDAGC